IYIGCLDLPWSDICFIFWSLYAGPECRLRQALLISICSFWYPILGVRQLLRIAGGGIYGIGLPV
ncbi:MAG: hypothetical protein ACLUVV_05400, partial [Christensenellales bacterium]